ncbi:hypothetical protein MKEN_00000300 [Mycena kentingensis (nom. inval.)]|nr:hypothetical protein MKEN_00000300 [Mycena kentingensis (nom. inval.)]
MARNPENDSSASGSDSESDSELLRQDIDTIRDPKQLQKIIRHMQAAKNASDVHQRDRFGDVSNIPDARRGKRKHVNSSGASHKRARVRDREPAGGRSDEEGAGQEEETPGDGNGASAESDRESSPNPSAGEDDEDVAFMRTAQKFLYTGGLWLEGAGRVLNHKLDRKWDAKERFSGQVSDKVQGQLRVLRPLLPAPYRHGIPSSKLPLVVKKLSSALTNWRPNISTRIRRGAGPAIYACNPTDLHTSDSRFEKFKDRMGHRAGGKPAEFAVALLHRDESRVYNKETFLLHPCLFRMHAALTHGQSAAVSMLLQYNRAKDENPDVEPVVVVPPGSNDDMAAILDLREITPHAIALTAVLVVWGVSRDDCLKPQGVLSGIDYEARFERYLKFLVRGLEKKDAAVLNIFKVWNEVLYSNKQPARAEGGDDDADAELEQAIAQMSEDDVQETS